MTTADNTAPVYQPFSWLPSELDGDPTARFAGQVRNIMRGGLAVANLIRKDFIYADSGQPPLLPGDELDGLVGLMIASFELMDEAAEDNIDHLEKLAAKKEKK